VGALFTEAAERFGEVGVLVNKTVIALIKPLARVREDDIDRMLTVNGKGTMSAASSRPRGFPGRQQVINGLTAERSRVPVCGDKASSPALRDARGRPGRRPAAADRVARCR
jgi:NAD(P)-dependent dehydrogenase (short-subunit alcohol dehydrogenase family)